MIEQRRGEDRGTLCWIAMRLSQAWDWIDKRQIVERFVSISILYGTVKITAWAMTFAETHGEKSGVDAAAIIVSVGGPYMALQAAAIAFMFHRAAQ